MSDPKDKVPPPPKPVTVQLFRSVKDYGETITALVFAREMNGGDLEAVDGLGENGTTLELIRRLARTPPSADAPEGSELSREAVRALAARDVKRLRDAMRPFVQM